jgi:phosphoglycerate dehydrogenase-like enzyme
MNHPRVVVPDDFPQVIARSRAYRELQERASVAYFDTLPGSEADLGARIADAEFVINIRASSKFTDYVFQHAGHLRLLSIWGTGTDNVVPTPHSAGIAVEVVDTGLAPAVENVWSFLAGEPANVVAGSAP